MSDVPTRPGDNPPGPASPQRTVIRYFGDYVLMGEIASGGMGVVHRARQVSLNRKVAIKLIRPDKLDRPDSVRRFRAEAEAMAALRSEHIVHIHEIGEHEGRHFISMELVEGQSLAEVIAECRMRNAEEGDRSDQRGSAAHVPPSPGGEGRGEGELLSDLPFGSVPWQRAAAALLAKVARAVHYAHQRGVIHRDLKPSNILVDDAGEPRLTDFGLAKLLESDSNVTGAQDVLGTPNYMAPEQAAGKNSEVTTATDTYSLGAILFAALTGRPPFLGQTSMEVLRQVIEDEPPRPRSINLRVDRDLEVICLKCLEKKPQHRPDSPNAVAVQLTKWLEGKPIDWRPVSMAERLIKAVRRRPGIAGLALALILSLGAGLLGIATIWFRAKIAEAATSSKEAELTSKRAAEFLQKDRVEGAMATLAQTVRRNPQDTVTAARLLSILSHGSFALPESRPLEHEAVVHGAGFSPDGGLFLALSTNGPVRIWQSSEGLPLLCSISNSNLQIHTALFSPDGRRIVTAAADKTARVWNSRTGQPETAPFQHDDQVVFASFSPDGLRVVTASQDKTARIWSVSESKIPPLILAHPAKVTSAQFSPDGRTVLTAAGDGQARVWDARTTNLALGPLRHVGIHIPPQFSPDGTRILTLVSNEVVAVWEAGTGRLLTDAIRHEKPIVCVQFSGDGQKVVTGSRTPDATARVWDASNGQPLTGLIKHQGPDGLGDTLMAAQFSPDDQLLATASLGPTVSLWDAASGARVREPLRHDFWTTVAAFSPDGLRLISGSYDKTARLWDIRPRAALNEPLLHQAAINAVTFSADGKLLLSVSADGTARFWNIAERQQIGLALSHGTPVLAGRFSDHETQAITFSRDGVIRRWNVRDGLLLASNLVYQGTANSARFSRDGQLLFTEWPDGVRIWHVVPGKLGPFLDHANGFSHAEFSPNGRHLVTVGPGRWARVWDAQTGQLTANWLAHGAPVTWAEFSLDGAWIATGSMDTSARVWNASTHELVSSFAHLGAVDTVCFSPDSEKLVSTSLDHTACIWDRRTGRELVEPLRQGDSMRAASFSRDGREVATVCRDGTVRVWDSATGLPLTEWLRLPSRPSRKICDFSPDGHTLVTATESGSLWVWDLLIPHQAAPAWLPLLADVVSGESQKQRPEDAKKSWSEFQQLKARVAASPVTDFYSRWAKWFFADPVARPISPGSRLPAAAYIDHRIKEGTLDSLREAVRLDATNGLALALLAARIAEQDLKDNPRKAGEADFLSRRALEFSPNDPQVQSIRAAIPQPPARRP